MTLWEQAERAQNLETEELSLIVHQCRERIEAGKADEEDYVRYIACKLELTHRTG